MRIQPSVIFFDVGDTLAYPHPSFHDLVANICVREGLPVTPEQVAAAEPAVFAVARGWLANQPYSTSAQQSETFWRVVYQSFLKEMGFEPNPDLVRRLFTEFTRYETYRLYPDAIPALQALRDRGLVLGVISNWEEWLEQLLASLEVVHFFQHVVASGVAGVEKPDRRIFEMALAQAGVPAEQAVHVGDSVYHDVQGARAVGITPVLIDRRQRYPQADCMRITDLRELEGLL